MLIIMSEIVYLNGSDTCMYNDPSLLSPIFSPCIVARIASIDSTTDDVRRDVDSLQSLPSPPSIQLTMK